MRTLMAGALSAALGGALVLMGCDGDSETSPPKAAPTTPAVTAPTGNPLPPVELTPKPLRAARAQSERDRPLIVIPEPKQMTEGEGAFTLRPGAACVLRGGDLRLSKALATHLPVRLAVSRQRAAGSGVVVQIGAPRAAPPADSPDDWRRNSEGYRLTVDRGSVRIEAPTVQGAFYGVQTLAQLLRPAGGGAYRCPAVEVVDWPSLAFRGAHWFPSRTGVPFHRKLLQRIMARFKLNAAVIQCEAAQWDTHPEIADKNSVSKKDLRGVVALARQEFIEPVPLINCPGHGQWMFRNGTNLEFAEDPRVPYAYCVRNPASDRFIKEILTETLDVFRPRYVHLGHDEVTFKTQFPNPSCPRCRGATVTQLLAENALRLHGWLAERKVGTMVWGDMLLAHGEGASYGNAASPDEAERLRKVLPPDTVIADWHYQANEDYPSLAIMAKHGFNTIGCSWYDPANIRGFNLALQEAGTWGHLQTTWAGYFPEERHLSRIEFRQFLAFVSAADYSWSGRREPIEALPYSAGNEFAREYLREERREGAGTLLDLSPPTGTRPSASAPDPWPLPGRCRLDGVEFLVPEQPLLIAARDGELPDWGRPFGSASLSVGRRTPRLALLCASLPPPRTDEKPVEPAWGKVVGRLRLGYADGTSAAIELKDGETTAPLESGLPLLYAPVGWFQRGGDGNLSVLRVTRLKNPHPDRVVASVRFEPADEPTALVLAGLTLLD